MSKLLKVKKYLSISEAAKHLSRLLEESVSVADIYELSLDKQLTISARFINKVYAKVGKLVTAGDNDIHKFPISVDLVTGEELERVQFIDLDEQVKIMDDQWLVFDKNVQVIEGIKDLAMIGEECHKVKELYQEAIDGPSPNVDGMSGFYVRNGERIYQLQDVLTLQPNENNIPALEQKLQSILKPKGLTLEDVFSRDDSYVLDCLDEDELDEFSGIAFALAHPEVVNKQDDGSFLSLEDPCYQLVVKTSELTRFVQSLQDESETHSLQEKPLPLRERESYLKSIGTLCYMAEVDIRQRGISQAIEKASENYGYPMSDDTVRKHLKQLIDFENKYKN